MKQTITATSASELLFKWVNSYRAKIDASNGDVYLDGNLYENVSTPTPPANSTSFLVKNSAGTVKAFINGEEYTDDSLNPDWPYTVLAGSLILAGEVVELDY